MKIGTSDSSLQPELAMSKRSWQEANLPSPHSAPGPSHSNSSTSPHSYHSPAIASPKKVRVLDAPTPIAKAPPRAPHQRTQSQTNGAIAQADNQKIPGISRKVKACAACRKQKVRVKTILPITYIDLCRSNVSCKAIRHASGAKSEGCHVDSIRAYRL
jgi:hypothetical protein